MKKLLLVLTLALTVNLVKAQNSNVNNAFRYLQKGDFEEAKTAIDLASEHPDTKDLAKVWFYRGNIYLEIARSKDPQINALDTDALNKAYQFYIKALEIDKEISNENLYVLKSPAEGISFCANIYYNNGIVIYQKGDYETAYQLFEKTNSIKPDANSIFMAGLSAYYCKPPKLKEAKKSFNDLVKKSYQSESIYEYLALIYKDEKDTNKAINIVNVGEKAFPDSTKTMINKFNIYIWAGKTTEAFAILAKIKDKDPKNPIIHYNIGTAMGDNGNFIEAEKAYLTAIELKPDYIDAYYNLGALYFNKFVDIKKDAEKIKPEKQEDFDKMDKLDKEAKVFLTKSRPYVEKCYEMNNKDKNTLLMLKQIYSNLGDNPKAKEISDILKTLETEKK